MAESETSKLKIAQTVVVEGKYDKIKLSSLLDAHIITCEGFGIFQEKEKTLSYRVFILYRLLPYQYLFHMIP